MSDPWKVGAGPQYAMRVLTFMDILGWKELVRESAAQPELVSQLGEALEIPETLVTQFAGQSIAQISQFSDHVCISLSGSLSPLHVRGACTYAKVIAENLMKLGFCVRGGIVAGQLVHDQRRIYGPALLEAHYIESQVAKYPRIVLSEGVAAVVGIGETMGFPKSFALKDTDGLSYLNVIDGNDLPARCETIRKAVLARMPPKPSLDVQAKRDWLLGYLTRVEAIAAG